MEDWKSGQLVIQTDKRFATGKEKNKMGTDEQSNTGMNVIY